MTLFLAFREGLSDLLCSAAFAAIAVIVLTTIRYFVQSK